MSHPLQFALPGLGWKMIYMRFLSCQPIYSLENHILLAICKLGIPSNLKFMERERKMASRSTLILVDSLAIEVKGTMLLILSKIALYKNIS